MKNKIFFLTLSKNKVVDFFNKKIKKYQTEVESITQKIKKYQTEVESITQKIKKYQTEVESITQKINKYQTEVESITQKINKFVDLFIFNIKTNIKLLDKKINFFCSKVTICQKKLKPDFFVGFATALGILVTLTTYAIENPFESIEGSPLGASVADEYKGDVERAHPLQQSPVANYTLMGVITSADKSIAMIRSSGAGEYFIHVGDLLGNAGGKVTKINHKGVEVKEKLQVVILSVRNKGASDE